MRSTLRKCVIPVRRRHGDAATPLDDEGGARRPIASALNTACIRQPARAQSPMAARAALARCAAHSVAQPVAARAHAIATLELHGEMTATFENNRNRNLQHGLIGGAQQPRRFLQPQAHDELMWRLASLAVKHTRKMKTA